MGYGLAKYINGKIDALDKQHIVVTGTSGETLTTLLWFFLYAAPQ